MAKEIIPPTPVPVKSTDSATIEDLYCASYLNYSEESFSDTSKELIKYLEEEYSNEGLGGTTRSFIAKNASINDIYNSILNANINGIDKSNIDKHVIMNESDNDVIIFAMLY